MAPAIHSVSANLREALASENRGGTASRTRKRLRNAFVIGEFAVALALLSGSGFMIQAFDRLVNDDPGFHPDGLLTFQVSVLEDRYRENDEIARYEEEMIRALSDIPGVDGVAVMSSLPRGQRPPTTERRPRFRSVRTLIDSVRMHVY